MRDRSGSANGRSSLVTYNIGRLDDDRHLYDEVISQDEWKKRFPAEGEIMALGIIPLEKPALVFGAVLGLSRRRADERMEKGTTAHTLWTEAVAALSGGGVHWSVASEWLITLRNGNQWWGNKDVRVALEVSAGDVVAACAKLADLGVPVAKVEPAVVKSTLRCTPFHSDGEGVAGGAGEGVLNRATLAEPPIRISPMGGSAKNVLNRATSSLTAICPEQFRGTIVEKLAIRGIYLNPDHNGANLAIHLLTGVPLRTVKRQLAKGTELRRALVAYTSNGDFCTSMLSGGGLKRPVRLMIVAADEEHLEAAYDYIEDADFNVKFSRFREKKPKPAK
jgi:hypothetical protein